MENSGCLDGQLIWGIGKPAAQMRHWLQPGQPTALIRLYLFQQVLA